MMEVGVVPIIGEEKVSLVEVGLGWQSDLAFEGVATGDGRFIMAGALSWREPPLTLMAMVETAESGHNGARVAGRIDMFQRSRVDLSGAPLPEGQTVIRGRGVFDVGEFGADVERMVIAGVLSGVSIDMAVNDWAFRDPMTGEIINPDEATEEQWEKAFLGGFEMAVLDGEIMAATVCPTPAFASAKISLLASAQSLFGASWKANELCAARFGLAEGQLCCSLWQPIAVNSGLVAAGGAPVSPPAEWFVVPEPDVLTPLTVTVNGQVFGHIAAWETCHTGFINGDWSRCVTAPRSAAGYQHFHVGELPCADGEVVAVGKLMLGEGHAPISQGREQARAHYDRTGTVGAFVRAVDGTHGIWVSGVLRSDLTSVQHRDFRANPPSGDWRAVDGNLELITAIMVPVPGFPVPRSQLALAASADGDMFVSALILSSDVQFDLADCSGADMLAVQIEGGTEALHQIISG